MEGFYGICFLDVALTLQVPVLLVHADQQDLLPDGLPPQLTDLVLCVEPLRSSNALLSLQASDLRNPFRFKNIFGTLLWHLCHKEETQQWLDSIQPQLGSVRC